MEPCAGMRRREDVAEYETMAMVRRLGPLAWGRFGDKFACEVHLLLAKLPGHILFNPDARCVGTICLECCDEDSRKRTAKKAVLEGISWPCRECGSEYGLTKVYETEFTPSDIIRVLFPWSGAKPNEAKA